VRDHGTGKGRDEDDLRGLPVCGGDCLGAELGGKKLAECGPFSERETAPSGMLSSMIARFVAMLIVLGALLTGAGVMLGVTHVKRSGVDCGTAFHNHTLEPSRRTISGAAVGGNTNDHAICDQPRSDRTSLVLAVLVPGAALLLAGAGLGFAFWSYQLGNAAGPNLHGGRLS
jgi:hypothetical protein